MSRTRSGYMSTMTPQAASAPSAASDAKNAGRSAGSARNSSGSTTTAHWPVQNWSSIWSRQRRTARVSRIRASVSGG